MEGSDRESVAAMIFSAWYCFFLPVLAVSLLVASWDKGQECGDYGGFLLLGLFSFSRETGWKVATDGETRGLKKENRRNRSVVAHL